MKKILIYILLLTIFTYSYSKIVGEVEFRLGDLGVKNIVSKKWLDIDEGDSINIGDTLKTGIESKCEIQLIDKSIIRMSENTVYYIETLKKDAKSIIFKGVVLNGTVWTNVNRKDKTKRDFEIKTPVAVAAVIGTIFKTEFDKTKQENKFAVLKGKVNINVAFAKKKKKKIINPYDVQEVGGPKEIEPPKEVTLEEWISIVKGEQLIISKTGTYKKVKLKLSDLQKEWDNYTKK